jgi:dihydroflavonol-4-reductase
LRVVEGDLRDPASVKRAVEGCHEVYHVAADYRFWARDPKELYDSNVGGTENLLQAAQAGRIEKFIHTSTVGTIGLLHQPQPCDETSPFDPRQFTSHYKRSKLQAEQVALKYVQRGVPVVVVNPSAPIGPWDRKPTPTGRIIVDFVLGKMPAYVHTGLNFVHVRDVAEGHWLAAQRGRVGERYILGNRNLSMREFLGLLAARTGRPAPRLRIPYRVAWLAGCLSTGMAAATGRPPAVPLEAVKMSQRFMFFDASKAVRELGLPQTSVETAVSDAVEWFANNSYFDSQTKATAGRLREGQEATYGSSI